MKSIQANQGNHVNDTCTDCGSFVDIGAVIGEDDRLLSINFTGEDALERAKRVAELASKRFDEVHYTLVETADGVEMNLTFGVAAEMMIFQLEQGL